MLEKINSKISIKIFIYIFVSFFILITSILLIQSLFIEKKYMSDSIDEIVKKIDDYVLEYEGSTNTSFEDINIELQEQYNLSVQNYVTDDMLMIDETDGSYLWTPEVLSQEFDYGTYENYERTEISPTLYYESYQYPGTDVISATFYKTMTDGKVLVISTSLNTISTSMDIIKSYYIWFYLIAFILSIIISRILSKKITTPIIEINNAAQRMSDMDFDAKIDIKSNDELGELSESLNKLSVNLKDTINSLENDITNRDKQELIRKEFTSNISHEIKLPLAVIKSHVEAIEDNINKSREKTYYKTIYTEIDRLDSLMKKMLKLSDLDEDVTLENIETGKFIKRAVKKFKPLALLSKNKIKISGDFYDVTFNKHNMELIIDNLIENAVKYSDECTDIRISSYKEDENVSLVFENSCPKISGDDLVKIWDRFYCLDKSHNKKISGSGLGLAIVKDILDKNNGEYKAENTKVGIKITITIKGV